MVPVKSCRFYIAIWLSLAVLLPMPTLAERSPIFGSASVEAISLEAARDITARGELADYYGGLAITFAYNAYIFSFYARYFAVSNSAQEQTWYGVAANYAYHAYLYASWAQTFSSLGR